jgi:imidazolonepropionase-like amidohydrolase
VFVNPTLHASGRDRIEQIETKEHLTSDERAYLDRLRRDYDYMRECFRLMKDTGVTLVCGSDSAWASYTMGGFQREIEEQVEAGMSPMEAITSATGDSARSCRQGATVGTLEAGKRADVLVVDGDPTTNVRDIWRVADVYQNGQRVDRGSAPPVD